MTEISTIKTDNFTMDYFKFGTGKKNLVIIPGLSVQSVMGAANTVAAEYKTMEEDFSIYD